VLQLHMVVRQMKILLQSVTAVNYIQNFIQHSSANVNSIYKRIIVNDHCRFRRNRSRNHQKSSGLILVKMGRV
jgi:hypothetical protein